MAFGVAHFTSGAGWGPGKITSALLAGLMFAIVYLAYGVEAPILLHWFFNYYWEAYGLAFQTYSEIAGTLSPLIEMQLVFFGYVTWFFLFAVAAWKLVGRLLALVKSKASTASVRDNRTN